MDSAAVEQKLVRVYYNVLYANKATFKAQGGLWDKKVRAWYMTYDIQNIKWVYACCCRGKCVDCGKEKGVRAKTWFFTKKPSNNNEEVLFIHDTNNYLTAGQKLDLGHCEEHYQMSVKVGHFF